VAFPDLRGTVEDVVVEGDRVAARVTWHGTHGGEFLGMGPTGKRVSFEAFHLVRFSQDRAVEWWGTADLLGALQQMGATISGPEGVLRP
jgi:predicted ester cyclase